LVYLTANSKSPERHLTEGTSCYP